jgi:TRAP-type C4-dicarboxylate transport system permease small subunit
LRWIDRLNGWLGETVAWVYLAAVLATAYEVVMRYLFNAPTTWAFEMTVLLCAVGYLVGGGFVTQRKAHIAITSVKEVAPPRLRWWMTTVAHATGLLAMAGLAWGAWRPALTALRVGERTGSAWNPPSPMIVKPLIVVAAGLIALQLVAHLVRHLRAHRR